MNQGDPSAQPADAANESQRCYLRGLYCVQDCAATSHKDCPRYLAGESPLPAAWICPRDGSTAPYLGNDHVVACPKCGGKMKRVKT